MNKTILKEATRKGEEIITVWKEEHQHVNKIYFRVMDGFLFFLLSPQAHG